MDTNLILKRLGLPKHSDAVYNVLLKQNKAMLVAHIASDVGVHRPAIYRALQALLQHSFISVVHKGKRVLYKAESPQRLSKEFSKLVSGVHTSVRSLGVSEAYIPGGLKFYEGSSGITAVFNDVIEHTPKGDTFYRYTSERDLEKVNRYLSKEYRTKRDKKKLERLVISNPQSGKQKKSRLERFVKFISRDEGLFLQNIIQLVYGDRVAFIDLNEEKAFIIENKQLAEFQKIIFQQLYKCLKD